MTASNLLSHRTVLYPWHHELDHAFHRLKEEQTRLLAEYHTEKLKRIDALETKMMAVETRQDKMQR
ncbi:hypothetical protein CYLTODRAFT_456621 [Cylindrobasidium torrendii FP15055 ss-10]|uniref:Uncharacterized protein n=1 Tax=Cylindrobasidium torrendii FP15055 ss-10 TaxID=1314674 RepID=A0A0D7B4K8_9AGAR|nr:hypothetical protein CYLTODRAFT_456621 [Cylindrobasidium torrendii FP15055 ss-10]